MSSVGMKKNYKAKQDLLQYSLKGLEQLLGSMIVASKVKIFSHGLEFILRTSKIVSKRIPINVMPRSMAYTVSSQLLVLVSDNFKIVSDSLLV